MTREAGKGDSRRPTEVTHEQFSNSWDQIFGKKKDELRTLRVGSSALGGAETNHPEQHATGTSDQDSGRA
jgi:hypothetical protein